MKNNKYSMKAFDYSVDMLLPDIKKAKDGGVNFSRPDLCRMVATKMFLSTEDELLAQSYDERVAVYIVQQAYRDLESLGHFDFGERCDNILE